MSQAATSHQSALGRISARLRLVLARTRSGAVAWRLAIGLILLQIALVTFVGLLIDDRTDVRTEATRALRAQGVAILRTVARELERGDLSAARASADRWLADDARIVRITISSEGASVVKAERQVAASGPDHGVTTISVDFRRNGLDLATASIDFLRPAEPWWNLRPWALQVITAASAGLLLAFVYLRRALVDLDPNAVVPDRVRNAFDLLGQGVVLFDVKGRIVLVNDAFQSYVAVGGEQIVGRSLERIEWLARGEGATPLWQEALASASTVRDRPVDAIAADGRAMRLLVRGGPIPDSEGRVRGGVLSFNDITAIDQLNNELKKTVTELALSHDRIETQNRQLASLATLDGLTGATNRRGFDTEVAATLRSLLESGERAALVMVDIDHFKSVNDRFGHLTGDDVIKRLAATLREELGDGDVLVRYGGEEFCVLLPRRSIDEAVPVAERFRAAVEQRCAMQVPGHGLLAVTASFGVAVAADPADTLHALVQRADAALYAAKRAGRNRVLSEVDVTANIA